MGIICEKDTHPRRKQIQLDPVRILRRGNGRNHYGKKRERRNGRSPGIAYTGPTGGPGVRVIPEREIGISTNIMSDNPYR